MAKHNKAFVLLRFFDDKLTSVWCKPLHYIYCSVPQKYDKTAFFLLRVPTSGWHRLNEWGADIFTAGAA